MVIKVAHQPAPDDQPPKEWQCNVFSLGRRFLRVFKARERDRMVVITNPTEARVWLTDSWITRIFGGKKVWFLAPHGTLTLPVVHIPVFRPFKLYARAEEVGTTISVVSLSGHHKERVS